MKLPDVLRVFKGIAIESYYDYLSLGYTPEEACGKTILEHFPEISKEEVRRLAARDA